MNRTPPMARCEDLAAEMAHDLRKRIDTARAYDAPDWLIRAALLAAVAAVAQDFAEAPTEAQEIQP